MIDTARFGFPDFQLSKKQLIKFWKHQTSTPVLDSEGEDGRRAEKTLYNVSFPVTEDYRVHFTYYPNGEWEKQNPYLLAELSLPKMVLGSNVRMVYDVEEAAEKANRLIASALPDFPPIDIMEGDLCRIDLCYNHYIESCVPYLLDILSKLSFPHRERDPYNGKTVLFRSKSHSTTFYDKQKQMEGNAVAQGILRQEQRINGHSTIKRLMKNYYGIESANLKDFFDPVIVTKCLEDDLEKLNLTSDLLYTYNEAYDRLVEKYSYTIADRLYGFLLRNQGKEKTQIAEERNQSMEAIGKTYKMIIDAGVSLVLCDHDRPIPTLFIDFSVAKYLENQKLGVRG